MSSPQAQLSKVDTKFPSIEKLKHLVQNIKFRLGDTPTRESCNIPLFGTTKLHGAHFDIVVSSRNEIRLQSRNILNLLAEGQDVFGFAKWMQTRRSVALGLRDKYHRRFTLLNPGIPIDPTQPLILACELTGPGIQKGVAVSQLEQRLVILTASINGIWLPDEPYRDISAEQAGIYNILRGGTWHLDLDVEKPEIAEAEMMKHTNAVEEECPFAKSFGVSGTGEGIVWKVADTAQFQGPLFWCKTKGLKHEVSRTQKVPKGLGQEKEAAFADAVVTTPRLEQMWTTLTEEMKLPVDKKSIGAFLKLLVEDCFKEEKDEIKEQGIGETALKKLINSKGKDWFTKRLRETTC